MIFAAVILTLTAAALFVTIEVAGNRVLRSRTKRRVLVTTTSGAWFAGVLSAHDRRSIVLRDAQTESDDGPAAVDGEVLILMVDVAHIQFP